MGVANTEHGYAVDSPPVSPDADDTVDISRVYTYKHQGGETRSATVLDIQANCPALGNLPLRQVARLAEASELGQKLLEEKTEIAEEDRLEKITKLESETPPEEGTSDNEMSIKVERHEKDRSDGEQESVTRTLTNNDLKQTASESGDADFAITESDNVKGKLNVEVKPEARRSVSNSEPGVTEMNASSNDSSDYPIKTSRDYSQEHSQTTVIKTDIESENTRTGANLAKTSVIKSCEDAHIEYEFPIPQEVLRGSDESLLPPTSMTEISTRPDESPVTAGVIIEDFPIPNISNEETAFLEKNYEVVSNQLSVPVEEVEVTLDELTDRIEALEPEAAAEVNQILDEIVQLPRQLETSAVEDIEAVNGVVVINEVEIRQELEQRFKALFYRLEIEYTPELIDSFVNLAINRQLEETLELKVSTAITEDIPKDRGTHEAITRILVSLSSVKQAISRAFALGRSALRLCRLENNLALAY